MEYSTINVLYIIVFGSNSAVNILGELIITCIITVFRYKHSYFCCKYNAPEKNQSYYMKPVF